MAADDSAKGSPGDVLRTARRLNRRGDPKAAAGLLVAAADRFAADVPFLIQSAALLRKLNRKPPANDPDRAFLAFFRKFAEANPL